MTHLPVSVCPSVCTSAPFRIDNLSIHRFFSDFAYTLLSGMSGLLMGKTGPFLTELLPLIILEK